MYGLIVSEILAMKKKGKSLGGKSLMSLYICINSATLKSQIAEISENTVHFKFSVNFMEVS